jgi:hypothetical protein
MSNQVQDAVASPLSEDERLQLLTIAGKRNRRFILALAGLLGGLMLLLIGFNLYSLMSRADESRIDALEQQVLQLEQQLAVQQVALTNQEKLLVSQQAATLSGVFAQAENPDSIAQVSAVLRAQERDYQQVMQGLKVGMRDLANMLPGSRSWLADYNEIIDRAEFNSQKRSEAIQLWSDEARQPVPAAKPPGTAVDPR